MLVFVTETHITEEEAFQQFYLPGYRVVSCLSHSRHTGGVPLIEWPWLLARSCVSNLELGCSNVDPSADRWTHRSFHSHVPAGRSYFCIATKLQFSRLCTYHLMTRHDTMLRDIRLSYKYNQIENKDDSVLNHQPSNVHTEEISHGDRDSERIANTNNSG